MPIGIITMQDFGIDKYAMPLFQRHLLFSNPECHRSCLDQDKLKAHMPVPFDTVKIKQREVIIVKLKRIVSVPMLYHFHHILVCHNLVVECIKIHARFSLYSSPCSVCPEFLPLLRYYTIKCEYMTMKSAPVCVIIPDKQFRKAAHASQLRRQSHYIQMNQETRK